MKPVVIFRHIAIEGPGYLGDYLNRHDIPFEILPVDEGARFTGRPVDTAGLVFMGGSMSANDDLDWVNAEIDLIREAHEACVPVLGHCLGGQLISRALGAKVRKNPVMEIGWHPVEVMNNDTARSWFDGLPASFDVYHWHGETFDLPADAQPLLKSAACVNQAYLCGNTLALQCHVEMQAGMVREWARAYGEEISTASYSVQTAGMMLENLDARVSRLNRVADCIYSHWLETVTHMGA